MNTIARQLREGGDYYTVAGLFGRAATEIERLEAELDNARRDLRAEMSDEIERLRAELQTCRNTARINLSVAKERADEIERLRADNERLRQLVTTLTEADPRHDLANKIERLRAALEMIAGERPYLDDGVTILDHVDIARAALEGK